MRESFASFSRGMTYLCAILGLVSLYVYYLFGAGTSETTTRTAAAGMPIDFAWLIVLSFGGCVLFWYLAVTLRAPPPNGRS